MSTLSSFLKKTCTNSVDSVPLTYSRTPWICVIWPLLLVPQDFAFVPSPGIHTCHTLAGSLLTGFCSNRDAFSDQTKSNDNPLSFPLTLLFHYNSYPCLIYYLFAYLIFKTLYIPLIPVLAPRIVLSICRCLTVVECTNAQQKGLKWHQKSNMEPEKKSSSDD